MPLGSFRLNSLARYVPYVPPAPSRTAKTITNSGTTVLSTAQSKFGGSSVYFNGSDAYYTLAGDSAWNPTGGDYTVEMWVYNTANNAYGSVPTQFAQALPNVESPYTNNWGFGTNNTGKVSLRYYKTIPGLEEAFVTGTTTISLNTWTHIAMVYTTSDTTVRLYVNGSLDASSVINAGFYNDNSAGMTVGAFFGARYQGYIEDLRVTTAAVYTSSFTPPTSQLTNTANTVLLVTGNGTNGSTNIVDDVA